MRLGRWLMWAAWMLITSSRAAEATPIPGMVKIASGTLKLGSDMAEIIYVAEDCSRRAEDPTTEACSPENFTSELNSAGPRLVKSFLIDRQEVSVMDYEHCVRAGRCKAVDDPRRVEAFMDPRLPVVFVSQRDAAEYCRFHDARLPTEAEFEIAMRGPRGRRYPWGNTFHNALANSGRNGVRVTETRDGFEMLAPTTAFVDGRSPEGVLQLSGNAAEWTSTPFSTHGSTDGKSSSIFVVKGGSFMVAPSHLRGAARRSVEAGERAPDIGFRCARDPIPSGSTAT